MLALQAPQNRSDWQSNDQDSKANCKLHYIFVLKDNLYELHTDMHPLEKPRKGGNSVITKSDDRAAFSKKKMAKLWKEGKIRIV